MNHVYQCIIYRYTCILFVSYVFMCAYLHVLMWIWRYFLVYVSICSTMVCYISWHLYDVDMFWDMIYQCMSSQLTLGLVYERFQLACWWFGLKSRHELRGPCGTSSIGWKYPGSLAPFRHTCSPLLRHDSFSWFCIGSWRWCQAAAEAYSSAWGVFRDCP